MKYKLENTLKNSGIHNIIIHQMFKWGMYKFLAIRTGIEIYNISKTVHNKSIICLTIWANWQK